MPYHIDFSTFSLNRYKKLLLNSDLVPSRRLLLDNLDHNFDRISSTGIENISQLLNVLKNKKNFQALSSETLISEEYLKILSREIRSTLPKTEKLEEFEILSKTELKTLASHQIKNTKDFWLRSIDKNGRKELSVASEISEGKILQLSCLSDLCRVKWVNHTFARILMMTGIKTAKELSLYDPEKLYLQVYELNKIHKWYKAKIGKADFYRVRDAASMLSFDLQL